MVVLFEFAKRYTAQHTGYEYIEKFSKHKMPAITVNHVSLKPPYSSLTPTVIGRRVSNVE